MRTFAATVADGARAVLPDSLFYRGVAAGYRIRRERRMLLLDELVPRGSSVVDVGAWWGPWTYWLSRRAATVWAFEPNLELASFLTGVVAPNVHIENVGLSDHTGTATLFAPPDIGQDALATLSLTHRASDAREMEVPLRRLDDYGIDGVSFIKLDAEGHEFEVLRGAEETIARWKPTLLIEIDQRLHQRPIQHVFEWLTDRGYQGRFRRRRSWAPLASFDVQRDQLLHSDLASVGYIRDFVFTHVDS